MPAAKSNKQRSLSFWCRGQNKSTFVSGNGGDEQTPPKDNNESSGSCFVTNSNSSPSGLAMSSCIPGVGADDSTTTTTPYERAIKALHTDECWAREITLGKRVGLYRLRGELGSGNFSKVRMAIHHLTKETVAIKTLDKTKLDAKTHRMLTREISVMQQLCHPNIVKLFEVIQTFDKMHLVLECAGGGELCARITGNGKMSEHESRKVFSQVLSAIDYLHSRNVIHRDIKSENVLLANDDAVKLGDFGFSTKVSTVDAHLRTFCGSPPYAAPELFQTETESYVGPPVDVWAIGVLLFFMVTGYMPFRANTVTHLKKLILDSEYELPNHVSIDCARLIRAILRRNPRERYTLEQIVQSTWLRRRHGSRSRATAVDDQEQIAAAAAAYCPYHPWPTTSPETRSELETETRRRMTLLGITDDAITDACATEGCNHPVIGTFRILMHVLHDTYGQKSSESEVECRSRPQSTRRCIDFVPDKSANLAVSIATSPVIIKQEVEAISSIRSVPALPSNSTTQVKKVKKNVIVKRSKTCTML